MVFFNGGDYGISMANKYEMLEFPKLDRETKTDVLIIGGGIVGMCS